MLVVCCYSPPLPLPSTPLEPQVALFLPITASRRKDERGGGVGRRGWGLTRLFGYFPLPPVRPFSLPTVATKSEETQIWFLSFPGFFPSPQSVPSALPPANRTVGGKCGSGEKRKRGKAPHSSSTFSSSKQSPSLPSSSFAKPLFSADIALFLPPAVGGG